MKKAMNILRSDLRGMKNNVMTAVVVFSLVVIPLLFSTFNVLASWNPFGNTDQLKIAVASADDGYESDLASLRINLGDQVLSQLSRNDQIDWVITAEDKAVEGTKAGDYYAAIVLPPSFSTDMLTFYVAGTEPSKLDLYTNEKKNALSTVITAQGADGMISQINETFTRTLSSVGWPGVVSRRLSRAGRHPGRDPAHRVAGGEHQHSPALRCPDRTLTDRAGGFLHSAGTGRGQHHQCRRRPVR